MKIKTLIYTAIFIFLSGCNSNDNSKISCDLNEIKKIKNIAKRQAIADKCAQDGSNIVVSKPMDWGNGPFDSSAKNKN